MTDNELKISQGTSTEIVSVTEKLPLRQTNRIVVYGSRTAGSFELSAEFQAFLEEKGITDPRVEPCRLIDYLEEAFFSQYAGVENPERIIPKGVIVLPELRAYSHGWEVNVSSNSFFGQIQALCDQYGVPIVAMDYKATLEDFENQIKKLLTAPKPEVLESK